MRRFAFLAVALVLLASAADCSFEPFLGIPGSRVKLLLIVQPAPDASWDAASLERARQILQERFGHSSVSARVTLLSAGQLQIALTNEADLEQATIMATSQGEIVFIDSLQSFPAGTVLDEVPPPILTSSDIEDIQVTQKQYDSTYMITIELNPDGRLKLKNYTSSNIGHYLIILQDGTVLSSPMVQSAIPGGSAMIDGSFTLEQAELLAAELWSGALPFPLGVVETETP